MLDLYSFLAIASNLVLATTTLVDIILQEAHDHSSPQSPQTMEWGTPFIWSMNCLYLTPNIFNTTTACLVLIPAQSLYLFRDSQCATQFIRLEQNWIIWLFFPTQLGLNHTPICITDLLVFDQCLGCSNFWVWQRKVCLLPLLILFSSCSFTNDTLEKDGPSNLELNWK